MTSAPGTSTNAHKSDALIIYENLMRMCEYRGAHVVSRVNADKFAVTMETNHYAQINAERAADDVRGAAHIVVIQFSTYRHIDTSSPKFSAFLDRVIKTRPADGIDFNIILITSAPVSSTIAKLISEPYGPGIQVEQFLSSMFLIIVPEHSCVPHHSIVPQAAVDNLCAQMHLVLQNFPIIANSDPMAIWLGVRTGMVVRIDRGSETAGHEVAFRRCV